MLKAIPEYDEGDWDAEGDPPADISPSDEVDNGTGAPSEGSELEESPSNEPCEAPEPTEGTSETEETEKDFNYYVMEVIKESEAHKNSGYLWGSLKIDGKSWLGNSTTTYYNGKEISPGHPDHKAYCCGFTFEVFLRAWDKYCDDKGRSKILPGMPDKSTLFKNLMNAWFVYGDVEKSKRGAGVAIPNAGIGKKVSLTEAKRGDFAQYFKDDNRARGHAIVITAVGDDGDSFTTFSA